MAPHKTFVLLPLALLFLETQGFFSGTNSSYMDNMLDTIKLRLYGRSLNDYEEYQLTNESEVEKLTRSALYDPNKSLVVYIHGYTETPESESVKTVISALMGISTYNLVAVNWSMIASKFYLVPALMAPEVGKLVAQRLDQWHRTGVVPLSSVYVIGHSLGGQVAGFVGKNVKEGKIPRITGLDPAFPGFSLRSLTGAHLTDTDAQFVDVIHSDGGVYGAPYSTGHADFYPNGGRRPQPGCPLGARPLSDDDFCSHWRSWRFFAESLNGALPPYIAVSCPSQVDFDIGKCDNNDQVVMGYYTPFTTRGTFYLETTSEAPFSKAARGVISSRRAGEENKK